MQQVGALALPCPLEYINTPPMINQYQRLNDEKKSLIKRLPNKKILRSLTYQTCNS
ncbi:MULTISPECIES: hypothetical protein [Calothrix]|uniref:hypothetical protein n=1 Tax=Calothrix TaxID=1186 RepID=UPI0030D947B2